MDVVEIQKITDEIKFRMHPSLGIRVGGAVGSSPWIQVRDWSLSAEEGGGRKWRISVHAAKSEVVQTCLAAAIAWFEHECRESFEYRGVNVFNPHLDVDSMVEARLAGEISFDTRAKIQGMEHMVRL